MNKRATPARLLRALAIGVAMLLGIGLAPAVAHAAPVITTVASPDIPLGGQLTDTATLSGGASTPSGTVTFRLYADDVTCTSMPVLVDVVALTSTGPTGGTATSTAFAPTSPGVYRWIATYDGDLDNVSVAGVCDDPAETRSVGQSTPVLTATATGDTQRGGQLADTAMVTGGMHPTGSVTFRLYGPNDPGCSAAPVFTSTDFFNPVNFDPTRAVSEPFTPTVAGVYRWIARYNGDPQNRAVSSACGDASQTRTVFAESMATTATARITLGAGQISDRATVASLFNATAGASVTFRLFGPDDASCARAPVFVDVRPLTLTSVVTIGIAQSAGFTPAAAGAYRWIASYSGDASNSALTGACNDPNETSTVAAAAPAPAPRCAGRRATIVAVAVGGRTIVTGTRGPDVIVGSAASEMIDGRGGNDLICAGRGNDRVRGGAGRDTIRGEDGADRLYGDGGDDVVVGGRGADRLLGGSGRDRLRAAGGGADRIDCGPGPGRDDAQLDRLDRQTRCEIVRRVR